MKKKITICLFIMFLISDVLRAENSMRPFTEEIVDNFRRLPIQDGGRIKPLDTFARFELLKLNGKRTVNVDGTKLDAMEWLLLCLFYPERAKDLPVILVDDSDAVIAVGIEPHQKKRSRYSYRELKGAEAELRRLWQTYQIIELLERRPHQQRIIELAENLFNLDRFLHYLDFAREPFDFNYHRLPGHSVTTALGVSGFLSRQTQMRRVLQIAQDTGEDIGENMEALGAAFEQLDRVTTRASGLYLFPPTDSDTENWRDLGQVIAGLITAGSDGQGLVYVTILEQLVAHRDQPTEFQLHLKRLSMAIGSQLPQAQQKTLYREVRFYKTNYFYKSLLGFVLSFLMLAVTWLRPVKSGWRLGQKTATVLLIASELTLIAGIVMRCLLRSRPPVSTLYETVLFITAVSVFITLVIEYANRRRIALAVSAALGAIGMFIAIRYEIEEAVDTMPRLIAVLDTNFWLSTHVTTVTIGYQAGLLAAAFSHVYIGARVLGLKRSDPDFYISLTRMTYGTVCFGLLFSFVGTVLGGIWANESWGRFWGWDPKENGALMIVLWNLVILHARLGEYIRELGLHLASVFLAIVVSFSWWGVNLLGIGLHSYGFASGIFSALLGFWIFECIVIMMGFSLFWRRPVVT